MLLTGEKVEEVALQTPKGILLHLLIEDISREEGKVRCAVQKDGGDDPDVTTGIYVYANVSYSDTPQITLDGGIGVGRVTKPGLWQAVGEAAINKVPRQMILENVEQVCKEYTGGLNVVIEIPAGVELAKKTFNPRLGIEGGISVLGTSGIVIPMSEAALVASLRLEMKMLVEGIMNAQLPWALILTGVGVAKLLDVMSAYLHSPEEASFAGVNPKNDEEIIREGKTSEPFSAFVFKTIADPFVGKLSMLRVCSGTLTSGTALYNSSCEKTEKAGGLFLLRGKNQLSVSQVSAGDIAALSKLQFTNTGDTLCDAANPIRYEKISFPEPSVQKAVYAAKQGEEDKVFSGLARLQEEDPSIRLEKNAETTETILWGQGELHLDVIRNKLQSKFGANAVLQDPRIPYRETIRKTVSCQGRHKKQSGGHGQFGDVWIEFRPIGDTNIDFEFEDAVVGGVVPRNFIPSVEKGLRENIKKGVLAGYPMVGLHAKLYDGSYHPVDSSEMAFKTAARIAYKKGCMDASPVLLEPIMHVEVLVPDEYMGDIMGDMNKRRGRIMGMNPVDGLQQVEAEVPLAEMFKYATDLRSMTQARGSFTMKFERYEEVPADVAKKIIESAKKDEDEEE